MKVILVPINNRPECVIALKQAFELGKRLGASVKGCHIREHKNLTIDFSDEGSNIEYKTDSGSKEFFAKLAEQSGYKPMKKQKNKRGAFWVTMKGSPEKLFSILGPVSDLIIVSRPAKKGKSLARQFMLSAILKSSRPVIVLPQDELKTAGKRICIAWNQSHQAAQAVAASLPLLALSEQVTIITYGEETKIGPKAKHLKSYLRSWNIEAKHLVCTGENDINALMNGFNESKSDLMVMGGYSRGKLKQLLFGGVTDYMLNESNIPVFMLHSPR